MRLVLVLFLLAASCTSAPGVRDTAPSPSPTLDPVARGGTLRVALTTDITTLDPWTASAADTFAVLRQIYETLVDVEPGGLAIVPRLARQWTVSADARTWTFTIRSGVRFHDGTPLDAAAVVFNFERSRAFARFDLASVLDSVAATDPSTVVFTLRSSYAPFLATLASPSFGIVSPSCVRQGPAWQTPGAKCGAGTGPFKLEAGGWKAGDRVTLTRNASYWGTDLSGRRLPLLDGVTFVPARDETARIGGLKAASLDLVLDLAPASIRMLQADPNVMPAPGQPFAILFIGFGQGRPFDSADVRRAVALTLDRGTIAQAVYAGRAKAATQLLPPGLLGYDDTLTQFSATDVNLAKKTLADAGASGMATDLWYSPESTTALPDPKRVAESLATDLAKMGATVTVRTEDPVTFAADAKAGRLPLWVGVAEPARADPDDFIADATADPVALELLRRARGEPDASKRGELYKQVSKLIQQSVSRIPLLQVGVLSGLSRKVHGFVPATIGPESLDSVFFGN